MSGGLPGAARDGVPAVLPEGGGGRQRLREGTGSAYGLEPASSSDERSCGGVAEGDEGPLPLVGLRVLDLSRGDAAGACTRLLAQLGAGVEPVAAAELAGSRRGAAVGPYLPGNRERDPRRAQVAPRGNAAGRHLAYDLVVSDLRPAEAVTLGLAPARLADWAPVVVSATTYGLDGPDADRPGPLPATASFGPAVDAALAGAHAAAAALAALRWARHTGRGVVVEVATIEVVAACLGDRVPCRRAAADAAGRPSAEPAGGLPPKPVGGPRPKPARCSPAEPAERPSADPVGRSERAQGIESLVTSSHHLLVLPCADGYVGLAASALADRASRADLAALTGLPALADPAVPLAEALGPWLRARPRAEVFHAAQLWRLPVVPALDPAEAPLDAQSVARGCWRAQGGRLVPRSPFRYAWTEANAERLAPGEENGPGSELLGGEGRWGASVAARADRVGGSVAGGKERGAGMGWAARLPLADVRVLDLGMVWAGPYCGRLLAGLGAEVIKIEGPRRMDGTRAGGRGDCAGAFGDLNRGKAGLVVDLASCAGRALFLRLARRADVVLENYSPRVMPNFGLDYAALARANPRLLMLSLPAFGASGPWRDYVAYGSGLELATGLAPRAADGRPVLAPVAYLDYLAGAYGAVGLLTALLARDRSGGGAHLERAPQKGTGQMFGARRGADCQLLGAHLELARHGGAGQMVGARQEGTGQIVGAHLELAQREVANQVLSAIAERRDARPPAAIGERQSRQVPGAMEQWPVARSPAALDPAVFAADRHLAARGLFAPPARAGRACHHYARLPWRLHGVPYRRERPAPAYGADTRRILRRVGGLPAAAIEELVRAAVVLSGEWECGHGLPAQSSRG